MRTIYVDQVGDVSIITHEHSPTLYTTDAMERDPETGKLRIVCTKNSRSPEEADGAHRSYVAAYEARAYEHKVAFDWGDYPTFGPETDA